ncbi:hypothetical protein [Plantactinospora sonchi]|uniref:Uncharacterized protein n=1 Tax=Plantactinospora sonchi TaxID=1544735 RepID=A0ABU7RT75_9ACTN
MPTWSGRAGGPVVRLLARLALLAGLAVVGFFVTAMLDGPASAGDRSGRHDGSGLLGRVVDAEPLTRRLPDRVPPPRTTVDRKPPVRLSDRVPPMRVPDRVPPPRTTVDRKPPVRVPDRTPSVRVPDRRLPVPIPDRTERTPDRTPPGQVPERGSPVGERDGGPERVSLPLPVRSPVMDELVPGVLGTVPAAVRTSRVSTAGGVSVVVLAGPSVDVTAPLARAVPTLVAVVPAAVTGAPTVAAVVLTAVPTVAAAVGHGMVAVAPRVLSAVPATSAGAGSHRYDVVLLQRAGPDLPVDPRPGPVVPAAPASGKVAVPWSESAPPPALPWPPAAVAAPGGSASPGRPATDPTPAAPVRPRPPDGAGPTGQRLGQAGGGVGQSVALPAGILGCPPPRAHPNTFHVDAYGAGRWPAVPALPG